MAIAAPTTPFVWGQAGAMKTPEQIARDREIAAALMNEGMDYSPVGHWLQGAARAAQGGVGALKERWAGEAETAGREGFQSRWDSVFGGGAAPVQTAALDPVAAALAGTPQTATDATAAMAAGAPASDFLSSLIGTESGGNWAAQNNEIGSGGQAGHFGRLQFGQARLEDAKRAGVLPSNVTPQQFMASPELQQQVEAWHFADIDQQAANLGLNKYIGQTVGGAQITPEAIRAMAHLGGIGGAQKFLESGGQHNPSDAYGTSLRDYALKHGSTGDAGVPTGGGSQSPLQMAQAPDMAALLGLASDPWANDAQRSIVESLMGQQMKQQDPMYQLQMRAAEQGLTKGDLEIQQLLAPPPPKETKYEVIDGQVVAINPNDNSASSLGNFGQPDLPTSYQEFQLGQQNPDYAATLEKGPLVTNIIQPNAGDDSFFSGLNAAEGDSFAGFLKQAPVAARNLSRLDQLDDVLQRINTGGLAAAQQTLGEFGINTEGLSDIQGAQALINSMVPEQRQPGSGPMSDADLALFKQSLPRLINQSGGNELITSTIRAINQYDMALAQITQEGLTAADMATTPQERAAIRADMRAKISALQNPMEGFKDRMGGFEGSSTPNQPALSQSQAPTVTTQQEYDALPSGSPYKAPDGSIRTKR